MLLMEAAEVPRCRQRLLLRYRQRGADCRNVVDSGDRADRMRKVVREARRRHESLIVDVVTSPCDSADATGDKIEIQDMPGAPRDVMVRARSIAAHTDSADQHVRAVVEGQAAAENIHAADLLSDHR